MAIPIKKELISPAFAVWGTKRGKKIFFFDQFEQQETINSVDGILTDLRDAVSNPSTTTPFYSLEKKGDICIFSIYTSINDWLGRSGYYAVSFLMHSNQEFKGSSVLEALKYFSSIYHQNAIKDSSQQNRISEYTDEEANKDFFQKEFKKQDNYKLEPILDSKLYKGTEKAYFNYTDENEIDTFFKNRNHVDIDNYQTIYFLPKEEETQTALTCIDKIPAFKIIEKTEQIITPKEETESKIKLPQQDTNEKINKDKKEEDENKKEDDLPPMNQNTKQIEQGKADQETKPTDSQPTGEKPSTNPTETKKTSFFKKIFPNKSSIILAVLIPVVLLIIGVVVGVAISNEDGKEEITENREDFSDEQLEEFMRELNIISSTVTADDWRWNEKIYVNAYKKLLEKGSIIKVMDKKEIDKESQNNLTKAKSHQSKKKAELNNAITKEAKKIINNTGFDFVKSKEVYQTVNLFNVQYADIANLRKYKGVAFRVFQAKEIIKENRLPLGDNAVKNDDKTPIDDIKKAADRLDGILSSILKSEDYIFLIESQKCHLQEWSNLLKARQHKKDIEDIIQWVVNDKYDKYPKGSLKAKARAQRLRKFLEDGTCTN